MSLPESADSAVDAGGWVLPPLEAVLPHRGEMRLLDRLLQASATMLAAEYQVPGQAWYSNANAAMPAWIGLEVMAQAVAAHVALNAMRDGGAARLGVLLGTRSYQALRAEFEAGTVLRIEARDVFHTDAGHRAYECMIVQQDRIVAQAVIKVFQPADFDEFIKGSAI
jgi:predicted hotdog family 3-hydroxylacyl-ACP dehydratase